jgi:hypothetical protein
MATLTPKLTLTGSAADFGAALSLAVSDSLANITEPVIGISQTSIATGSAQALVASNSKFSYTYIRVVSGTNSSDWVQVKLGGTALLKMRVGEFAWIPLYSGIAITAEAQGGACVVETAQYSATS